MLFDYYSLNDLIIWQVFDLFASRYSRDRVASRRIGQDLFEGGYFVAVPCG
jgi:hypothetical protein